jgi:hypothetical protein
MAGEQAKLKGTVIKTKEKEKRITNRARNFMGRIFRTGTEMRNLIDVGFSL